MGKFSSFHPGYIQEIRNQAAHFQRTAHAFIQQRPKLFLILGEPLHQSQISYDTGKGGSQLMTGNAQKIRFFPFGQHTFRFILSRSY
jgi:hypothetical protein